MRLRLKTEIRKKDAAAYRKPGIGGTPSVTAPAPS
jgi:hypothetical protein